ncbi:MAG TPA: hypothetical protein VFV79_08605, partial [Saprospiraceae bacterium]|nr:hypothetical protein [Saprospiraceae bacterium]
MKTISLLVAFLVCLGISLQAQSTTPVEKNTATTNSKRITITTTKTDENGKPVTETWIAEGEQPEAILQQMAINPDVMEKVEIEKLSDTEKGERLFLFRSAGDKVAIEGRLDSLSADKIIIKNPDQKIVIITNGDESDRHDYAVARWYGKHGDPWAFGEQRIPNCAALGI